MIDWARVHQAFENGTCPHWQACGTHCCNSRLIFKHFEWLGKGCMTALPMAESEAAFLKGNGSYARNFPDGEFLLPFRAGGMDLTVVLAKCNQNGVCGDQPFRPLICKLYPYVPAFEADGTCTGVVCASVFDLFWDRLTDRDPCEMKHLETQERFVARYSAAGRALAGEPWWPELRWWLNAGAAFLRNVRETTLRKLPERRPPAEFFPAFETLYLSGEAYDLARFQREMPAPPAGLFR